MDYNTKTCTGCKRELVASTEFFSRHPKCKLGLNSKCKECRGGKFGIHMPNVVNEAKDGHKICTKCTKELPHNQFYKRGKSGVIKAVCKKCVKIKNTEHNSKPEVKVRKSKYNKEYNKVYRASAEYIALNKKNCHARRSRIAGTIYNFTVGDWKEILEAFGDECAYCGQTQDIQQEHIVPVSKGGYYTKQNIIPACKSCNQSKGVNDHIEWYSRQTFFSEQKLKKINKWANIRDNFQQLSIL